jgi:hypothetical protein
MARQQIPSKPEIAPLRTRGATSKLLGIQVSQGFRILSQARLLRVLGNPVDPSSLPDAPLSSRERDVWNTAVICYADKFAGRSQVFDDELIEISAARMASSGSCG